MLWVFFVFKNHHKSLEVFPYLWGGGAGSENGMNHNATAGDWESICESRIMGTSLAVQRLRLHLPMQRIWVRTLVGELRSHMPRGQKTKT